MIENNSQTNEDRREWAVARTLKLRTAAVGFAFSVLRDFQGAEDVFQEAVVVVLRRLDTFKGDQFDAWFWQILRNVMGSKTRSLARNRIWADSPTLERIEACFSSSPLESEAEEDVETLVRCLEEVGGTKRKVLQWRYREDLSIAAIAKQLDRTVQTTYTVLKRARQAIRACVERKAKPRLT